MILSKKSKLIFQSFFSNPLFITKIVVFLFINLGFVNADKLF